MDHWSLIVLIHLTISPTLYDHKVAGKHCSTPSMASTFHGAFDTYIAIPAPHCAPGGTMNSNFGCAIKTNISLLSPDTVQPAPTREPSSTVPFAPDRPAGGSWRSRVRRHRYCCIYLEHTAVLTQRAHQVAASNIIRPQHSQYESADVSLLGARQHPRPVRGGVQRHRRPAAAASCQRRQP